MSRPSPLRRVLAPTAPLPVVSLATAALLLTACGTERTDAGRPGASTAVPPSSMRVDDPGKDGVRVTSLTLAPPSPSPSPSADFTVSAESLDSGVSATFEVTNDGTEALTYSIVFTFMSGDGGAMANPTATVRDVAPGKTASATVRVGALPPTTPRITQVKVAKVTKVPAAEAPAEAGSCPSSGIRVSVDQGDAAMGLRVVGLHLDNCGTRPYTVEGYPLLELLGEDREPVDGVTILDGSGEITTGAGPDERPRPVTLAPGESATAGLVWRNTVESGTPVDVPYVRVRAKAGADPVTVTPNLDLGTTGKLGVRPWKKTQR
ncbi:DUF4232 domain-containing protein [Streptomyces sp. DH12]|uniref:DUF4232 domain-containing protein n=1 Tax=Streptomyces sp. DH12 TaxID=2857010 RepID=UPI001E2F2907|nr:DUF4232 domain-containing protein [Streptomyces sp. DH12]